MYSARYCTLARRAIIPTRYPWVVLPDPVRDVYYPTGMVAALCAIVFPRMEAT